MRCQVFFLSTGTAHELSTRVATMPSLLRHTAGDREPAGRGGGYLGAGAPSGTPTGSAAAARDGALAAGLRRRLRIIWAKAQRRSPRPEQRLRLRAEGAQF